MESTDFTAEEEMDICIQADGTDISCQFTVTLHYISTDAVSDYEVESIGTYPFSLNASDYYESGNTGISNSYSLCKVTFTTTTGKMYVDCIGEGEASYDFGILSAVDQILASSNAVDSGAVVKKSFYGLGKYTQTVEYDVDDDDEHFIYIKYRKDSSVNTGADNLQFAIRFEES